MTCDVKDAIKEIDQVLSEHGLCRNCKFRALINASIPYLDDECRKDGAQAAAESIGFAAALLSTSLSNSSKPSV